MTEWRLIVDGRYPSARNMERDQALFEELKRGELGGSLRIYNWETPAVTVGYHQKGFMPFDRKVEIPVIRRPTGGGAVLHDNDITFSICTPLLGLFSESIQECYRHISSCLAQTLRTCGLAVDMQGSEHTYAPVCFARSNEVELVLHGRKIMGAAQVRRDGCLLLQGVIPLTVDGALYNRVFGPDSEPPRGILEHNPDFQLATFIRELTTSVARILGVRLVQDQGTKAHAVNPWLDSRG